MANQVDLHDREAFDLALRIGTSWVEIRRGASTVALRDHLFGTGAQALELGMMDTLDLLAQQPSWRMSDLAEALRVDPSTATRAVQRLVSAGLAERRADADDGRVVVAVITSAGRARHHEVNLRRAAVMSHLLGAFESDERAQLAEFLERFVTAVDKFVADLDDR
jgi:DNA-binding MarR family transcriptional regulator